MVYMSFSGVLKKYAIEAKSPSNSVDEGIKLKLSGDSTAKKEEDTNSGNCFISSHIYGVKVL